MASPGSSNSSSLQTGSDREENRQMPVLDERKRRRMESNRESARRSRMRKQKHVEDLTAQIDQIRKQNNGLISTINTTTQQFLRFESENSVLRAQVNELTSRLDSLNEIINNTMSVHSSYGGVAGDDILCEFSESFMNPWSSGALFLNQPIMAASCGEMFQY